jgi:hypothetical protein
VGAAAQLLSKALQVGRRGGQRKMKVYVHSATRTDPKRTIVIRG